MKYICKKDYHLGRIKYKKGKSYSGCFLNDDFNFIKINNEFWFDMVNGEKDLPNFHKYFYTLNEYRLLKLKKLL